MPKMEDTRKLLFELEDPVSPETIVFEKSTPGTETFKVPGYGIYEIYAYGAGGGSGAATSTSDSQGGIGTGGSGAGGYIIANILDENTEFTITVGNGGQSYAYNGNHGGVSTDGEDTIISTINFNLTSGGGKRGIGQYSKNSGSRIQQPGAGGTYSISNTSNIIILEDNLMNGKIGKGYWSPPWVYIYGGYSVYNNTYTGYGAGATVYTADQRSPYISQQAVPGYVRIKYLRLE